MEGHKPQPGKKEMPPSSASPPPSPSPSPPSPLTPRVLRNRDTLTPIVEKNDSIIENEDGDKTLTEIDDRQIDREIDDRHVNFPESTQTDRTKVSDHHSCSICTIQNYYQQACHYCKKVLCFKCTGLPKLNFLFYFKTKSQFRCESCCRKELCENRNVQVDVEVQKLEDEIMIIELSKNQPQTSSAVDIGPVDDRPAHARPNELTITTSGAIKTQENDSANGDTMPDCKYFLRGECLIKKPNCKFEHPKLCIKFLKGRLDVTKGCTKENCKFLHP